MIHSYYISTLLKMKYQHSHIIHFDKTFKIFHLNLIIKFH